MSIPYIVALPAAGSGKRMGADQNKLFLSILDRPILVETLRVFDQDSNCKGIWLAVKDEEREIIQHMLETHGIQKVKGMPTGGAERQHSVHACIEACKDIAPIMLVHDAARPFIPQRVITHLVEKANEVGAAVAAVKVKDTMKRVQNGIIEETVDRETLWSIQTPQAFQYELLARAAQQAVEDEFLGTDEAMLVERLGIDVHVVESTYENIKVTTPEDIVFGEAILKKRLEE